MWPKMWPNGVPGAVDPAGRDRSKLLQDNAAEGTGFEPVRACAQRFSRSTTHRHEQTPGATTSHFAVPFLHFRVTRVAARCPSCPVVRGTPGGHPEQGKAPRSGVRSD